MVLADAGVCDAWEISSSEDWNLGSNTRSNVRLLVNLRETRRTKDEGKREDLSIGISDVVISSRMRGMLVFILGEAV